MLFLPRCCHLVLGLRSREVLMSIEGFVQPQEVAIIGRLRLSAHSVQAAAVQQEKNNH